MTTDRIAYLYVQETLSDWEPAYATAELNSGRFFKVPGHRVPVKTVGATHDPITTMGGLRITPDLAVDELDTEAVGVLILVGGDTWQDSLHQPIVARARELLDAGALVAAICGATAPLAQAGMFDDRPHTSNSVDYLRMVAPDYQGAEHYRQANAIADGNLITAGSAGALPFARHILERLDVMSPAALQAWYEYFDTGQLEHFSALMNALPRSTVRPDSASRPHGDHHQGPD